MNNKPTSRRDALKAITATGVVAGATGDIKTWVKPVVQAVLLPAHAQTSSDYANPLSFIEDPCFLRVICGDGAIEVEATGQITGTGPLGGIEVIVDITFDGDTETLTTNSNGDGSWGPISTTFSTTDTSGTVFGEVRSPEFDPDTCEQSFNCREDRGGDGECAKIEGAQIGQSNLPVNLGSTTVTITSWTLKEKESESDEDEYVGFELDTGTVCFVVKAGTGCFTGSGGSWENPNGTSGPDAKGISNITFCPEDLCPPDIPGNCQSVTQT